MNTDIFNPPNPAILQQQWTRTPGIAPSVPVHDPELFTYLWSSIQQTMATYINEPLIVPLINVMSENYFMNAKYESLVAKATDAVNATQRQNQESVVATVVFNQAGVVMEEFIASTRQHAPIEIQNAINTYRGNYQQLGQMIHNYRTATYSQGGGFNAPQQPPAQSPGWAAATGQSGGFNMFPSQGHAPGGSLVTQRTYTGNTGFFGEDAKENPVNNSNATTYGGGRSYVVSGNDEVGEDLPTSAFGDLLPTSQHTQHTPVSNTVNYNAIEEISDMTNELDDILEAPGLEIIVPEIDSTEGNEGPLVSDIEDAVLQATTKAAFGDRLPTGSTIQNEEGGSIAIPTTHNPIGFTPVASVGDTELPSLAYSACEFTRADVIMADYENNRIVGKTIYQHITDPTDINMEYTDHILNGQLTTPTSLATARVDDPSMTEDKQYYPLSAKTQWPESDEKSPRISTVSPDFEYGMTIARQGMLDAPTVVHCPVLHTVPYIVKSDSNVKDTLSKLIDRFGELNESFGSPSFILSELESELQALPVRMSSVIKRFILQTSRLFAGLNTDGEDYISDYVMLMDNADLIFKDNESVIRKICRWAVDCDLYNLDQASVLKLTEKTNEDDTVVRYAIESTVPTKDFNVVIENTTLELITLNFPQGCVIIPAVFEDLKLTSECQNTFLTVSAFSAPGVYELFTRLTSLIDKDDLLTTTFKFEDGVEIAIQPHASVPKTFVFAIL